MPDNQVSVSFRGPDGEEVRPTHVVGEKDPKSGIQEKPPKTIPTRIPSPIHAYLSVLADRQKASIGDVITAIVLEHQRSGGRAPLVTQRVGL